jgi:adenine-specific DNA-methyltransferase
MATGVSKSFWSKESGPENFLPKDFLLTWSNQNDHRNKLFYGENLAVLRSLIVNDKIRGKIKLIYIDPPYSTNMIFQTRDQVDAYTDLLKGDDYISFISERLTIMRDLLSEEGSIFVHLDANMVFHVKVLMDEIFGRTNFRGMITRQKCRPKNYTKKTFGNISDYILYYSKGSNPIWNRPLAEWTEAKSLKEYQYVEEGTGRRYKKVPIHAPGVRNGSTGGEWRGMLPPPGKHWQYTPTKLDEFDAKGEIYWSGNGNPRRKVYLDTNDGIPIQDIWLDCIDAANQNTMITGYPTEKNPLILRRIIEAASNKGDLVLDCFAGSGTTLSVASELERNWIGIDCSEIAIRTILNRFVYGTEKMGDFVMKQPKESDMPLFSSIIENEKHKSNTSSSHKIVNNFSFYLPTEIINPFSDILSRLEQSSK